MGADEKLRRAVSKDAVLASSVLMDQPGDRLVTSAAVIRDRHFGSVITYSPKVFIPLTQLCRDVCHYCTFAKTPSQLDALYVDEDALRARGLSEADLMVPVQLVSAERMAEIMEDQDVVLSF